MSNHEINVIPSGDTLIIREGSANDIFQYKGFKYTADSTDSLVALVKSKADRVNCIIAYNEKGFNVIVNDDVYHRPQDRLVHEFKKSQQYQEWATILERSAVFNQKDFIDFLRRREYGEIDEIEALIAAIQNFKYVTNISGDFT